MFSRGSSSCWDIWITPLPAPMSSIASSGLSQRITDKRDPEKIQSGFDPTDVSGAGISNMVTSAFPGYDLPMAAQEPTPKPPAKH